MILTTAIIKGGTGKTTTAAALAQAAASKGKRVLCVDLEPQSNLSFFLQADSTRPGSYDLLKRRAAAVDLIQPTAQHIDIITGSAELATITTRAGSGEKLREALTPIKRSYDLIIIDTAPAFSDLVYNAILASDYLLIPLALDMPSIKGALQIHDVAENLRARAGHGAGSFGAIITRANARGNIYRKLQEVAEQYLSKDNISLLGAIRQGVAIQEAQALQKSLYDYAPNSKPAADYMNIYNTLMHE